MYYSGETRDCPECDGAGTVCSNCGRVYDGCDCEDGFEDDERPNCGGSGIDPETD